jgi:hypothetical protein
MGTRVPLLTLVFCALLALAPAANAATPFTAGTGKGHDLAVDGEGRGHVVWLQDVSGGDQLHYCRVPAGGSACDGESGIFSFPGLDAANTTGDAQVFTPTATKVVIVASCWNCGAGSTTDRTYRWVSNNSGVDFGDPPAQVGNNLHIAGQAAFLNAGEMTLGVEGPDVQLTDAAAPSPDILTADLAGGSVFSSPTVVYDETLDRAVYAVSQGLNTVRYAYRADLTPTANEFNNAANWQIDQFLSGAEGDNEETHLSTGTRGIFLTYTWLRPNDARVGLRKFDPVTNTFSGPTYVEGPAEMDNSSLGHSYHSQDGSGRIHVAWRTLFDGNRLRYTRSDDGGATFTPVANLAIKETFSGPIVEAATSGTGFAVWGSGGSAIRVVPIDPQPEPAGPGGPGGPGGPDTTPPTAGGLAMGDLTLTPGQGTSFTFTSSEAGIATLTVQKQVKGLKVRVRGSRRLRCVPQTRRRLRALRRQAGSDAAFRRLLRQRRCKAYKKIGSIRQAVTPGNNTIVFSGRIAGRPLRAGRYRALLVIRDSAGNLSRVERIRFRVLRRRRAP